MDTNTFCLLLLPFLMRLSCVRTRYVLLSDIVNTHYNPRERPPKADGESSSDPVKVSVQFKINDASLSTVQEEKCIIVRADVEQTWSDSRLIFPEDAANDDLRVLRESNSIWMPDLAFASEKVRDSRLWSLQIFRNGTVRSVIGVSLKTFVVKENYLTTTVRIVLLSVHSTTEDLVFQWSNETEISYFRGIWLDSHLSDPLFTDNIQHGSCESKGLAVVNRFKGGNYSCLFMQAKTILNKGPIAYVYFPTALCVALSWISFWMDKSSFLGRFSIPSLALVLLLNQKVSILNEILLVPNARQISYWIYACIFFVIFALLEVVVVTLAYGCSKERYQTLSQDSSKIYVLRDRKEDTEPIREEEDSRDEGRAMRRPSSENGSLLRRLLACFPPTAADAINVVSRCLFPVAFLIYVVSYAVSI